MAAQLRNNEQKYGETDTEVSSRLKTKAKDKG